MRLIFAGTSSFAAPALDSLLAAGHEILWVLTQPDRPAGRGMRLRASAVKTRALAHGLEVVQPERLESDSFSQVKDASPDAIVVAAYGLLVPPQLLAIPARGALNIHASLLPRWRGAAPIQRALLAGDSKTGITIMQMDPGLDTGAILLQREIAIDDEDTAQSLQDSLATLGARCIVEALDAPPDPRPQENRDATYAHKIQKAEALIDWSAPASAIWRQVRAFNPAPGASTSLGDTALKIWRAAPSPTMDAAPGTVTAADATGISVATGSGGLKIAELQTAGSKRVTAAAFISGHHIAPGRRLGA